MCSWFREIKLKSVIISILGSAFLAFGLYNVHAVADVTEGGVLGLTLLLDHWLHISPSVSGAILNLICYGMGWKLLGKTFIVYSLVSTAAFSGAYRICECFPPLWPGIADYPLLAALIGPIFVGVGAGVCVREGGAPGGDDALAMSVSHLTGLGIQWVYLISDFIVLGASLSYIPLRKIGYSILTVILSGQLIGIIQDPHKLKYIFNKR